MPGAKAYSEIRLQQILWPNTAGGKVLALLHYLFVLPVLMYVLINVIYALQSTNGAAADGLLALIWLAPPAFIVLAIDFFKLSFSFRRAAQHKIRYAPWQLAVMVLSWCLVSSLLAFPAGSAWWGYATSLAVLLMVLVGIMYAPARSNTR